MLDIILPTSSCHHLRATTSVSVPAYSLVNVRFPQHDYLHKHRVCPEGDYPTNIHRYCVRKAFKRR